MDLRERGGKLVRTKQKQEEEEEAIKAAAGIPTHFGAREKIAGSALWKCLSLSLTDCSGGGRGRGGHAWDTCTQISPPPPLPTCPHRHSPNNIWMKFVAWQHTNAHCTLCKIFCEKSLQVVDLWSIFSAVRNQPSSSSSSSSSSSVLKHRSIIFSLSFPLVDSLLFLSFPTLYYSRGWGANVVEDEKKKNLEKAKKSFMIDWAPWNTFFFIIFFGFLANPS